MLPGGLDDATSRGVDDGCDAARLGVKGIHCRHCAGFLMVGECAREHSGIAGEDHRLSPDLVANPH